MLPESNVRRLVDEELEAEELEEDGEQFCMQLLEEGAEEGRDEDDHGRYHHRHGQLDDERRRAPPHRQAQL